MHNFNLIPKCLHLTSTFFKVNDESIEHMTTSEIIDLLRIVRGPVCIVVSRVKSNEDCQTSNAVN